MTVQPTAQVNWMAHDQSASCYAPHSEQHRFEIYQLVHKGLRAFMLEVLTQVGRLDCQDDDDVLETVEKVRGLILICRSHLLHENQFIHAAMEACVAGSACVTAQDHIDHELACQRLEQRLGKLLQRRDTARQQQANKLYRQLALFIAENFAHMHVEEIDNTQALWQHYSDAELLALQQRLVASIPPEQEIVLLRWMLPHVSPQERAQVLQGIRQAAPRPVFETILATTRAHLNCKDWQKLVSALAT